MAQSAFEQILKSLASVITWQGNRIVVNKEKKIPEKIDGLIHEAVFGDAESKTAARWIIWETAQALGIRPASIHEFYMAIGRGDVAGRFTVPAINLRMLAFDSARAVFRAARKLDVGALIFEIARSEIGYTDQRPAEYATAVLAAAIREGFRGPVFIQGDHFQASAAKFASAPEAEVKTMRDLILEAIAAGFYNIDIDTSTLVDLSKPTLDEQQGLNYGLCADFTKFIREHEPKGITISVGGEIGEVGQKNSTPEDLDAFMKGFNAKRGGITGISKISIQTGTSHGGVVLPDGTLAQVAIDFEALKILGQKARKEFGLGGAVQHGASTLPETAFHKFVEAGTCEVHLATAFQNLIMEHEAIPESLRQEMHEWVKTNAAGERKPKDTDAQFFYRSRKKAVGPFKKQFWSLPDGTREEISASLQKMFSFLFEQLNAAGTTDTVKKLIKAPEIHLPLPAGGL
ncbi:MAG: class II D-tagatose-bisphosphate aldolase, non-catalytic subunit [Candidatus Aminicenantes bacterium]|nr:class II D-tagatose-bisphosphate aldolase, non-catalytic subunit [Candidatus Aminicenantes bacterium]